MYRMWLSCCQTSFEQQSAIAVLCGLIKCGGIQWRKFRWGGGGNCPPTSRRIVNLSEIFILLEVRKYMSYSDKTVIISKFPTN